MFKNNLYSQSIQPRHMKRSYDRHKAGSLQGTLQYTPLSQEDLSLHRLICISLSNTYDK